MKQLCRQGRALTQLQGAPFMGKQCERSPGAVQILASENKNAVFPQCVCRLRHTPRGASWEKGYFLPWARKPLHESKRMWLSVNMT